MNVGLSLIRQELKRLQAEGVDHVYVGDSTLEQMIQSSADRPATKSKQATVGDLSSVPTQPVDAKKKNPFPAAPVLQLPEGSQSEQMQWLRQTVLDCPTCREHSGATGKVVFGEGSVEADLFFCGDAPGEDEARSGRPFVDKAGELLEKIISAMGLPRDQVYMANIMKWRPEHDKPFGNRSPTAEEMSFCLPYLQAQIKIVQPKVLIALGNTAISGLLGPDPARRMGAIRGTWQTLEGTPLMATYHPSYLLRRDDSATKRQAWEDMLEVMEKVGLPISQRQRAYFLPKV
jgi:uracil-DNA glycosylase family 4